MADQINDGGPAFPCMPPLGLDGNAAHGYPYSAEGMSLRDHFAGLAMQAAVRGAVNVKDSPEAYARIADHAYRMADAMLKAREVRHG